MRYDRSRQTYILQPRTFWTGLLLLMLLIAVGIDSYYRLRSGGMHYGLVALLAFVIYMVLKINFTILLSIQVELYPEGPEGPQLLMKSLLNSEDVTEGVRAVELILPPDGEPGRGALALDGDTRYELFGWTRGPELDRVHDVYARQIARALGKSLRLITRGQGREVVKPTRLRVAPLVAAEAPPEGSPAGAPALAGARVDAGPGRLSVRWRPARPGARALWGALGVGLAGAVALAGSWLISPAGRWLLVTLGGLWLYVGGYAWLARAALRVDERSTRHGLANPLLALLYRPLFAGWRVPTAELVDLWVAGEPPLERLYLEGAHDLVWIDPAPLPGAALEAAVRASLTPTAATEEDPP